MRALKYVFYGKRILPYFSTYPGRDFVTRATSQTVASTTDRRKLAERQPASVSSQLRRDAEENPSEHNLFDLLLLPQKSGYISYKESLLAVELENFWQSRPRTIENYSFLIRASGEQGDLKRAFKNTEVAAKRFETNRVSIFASYFAACATARSELYLNKGISLFQQGQLQHNEFTFSALISAFGRCRNLSQALLTFQDAVSLGYSSNLFALLALVLIICKVVWTSVINACIVCDDLPKAWENFIELRRRGLEPDEVVFTSMITACHKNREVERALGLYDEMCLLGLRPTEVTFTALISAFGRRPDYADKAFELLERMEAAGFSPNLRCYVALLSCCSRNGNIARAESLLVEMRSKCPESLSSSHVYNTMLLVYARAQKFNIASQEENISKAESIFEALCQLKNFEVTNVYLCNLLLVYTSAMRINRAEIFFNTRFEKHGLIPCRFAITMMVDMYSQSRRAERAIPFFRKLTDTPGGADYAAYMAMILCCIRSNYLRSAVRLLAECSHSFRHSVPCPRIQSDPVVRLLRRRLTAFDVASGDGKGDNGSLRDTVDSILTFALEIVYEGFISY